MLERTIENPVTGERLTFLETSRDSGGAHTLAILDVGPGGGVPGHSHDAHEERIEVIEGVAEVRIEGVRHRVGAGQHIVIPARKLHRWSNASKDRRLVFRGSMTPGHPGFEVALRVLFGLARDGEVRRGGLPERLGDLALFMEWNDGRPSGPGVLLQPLLTWAARRARAKGRAAELLGRYGCEEPARTYGRV